MGKLCPANIIYIFRFLPYKKKKTREKYSQVFTFYISKILKF